ncbi:MAG: hypothetical protein MK135_10035, partial [Polyangiaceae bacterium]|nr:hypothetical protein [Polyangiaceae bacterium]
MMVIGERLFGKVSVAHHAYALGVIAAAGEIGPADLEVELRGTGYPLLPLLGPAALAQPGRFSRKKGKILLRAPLAEIAADIMSQLKGSDGSFMAGFSPELARSFLLGIFDAAGKVSRPDQGFFPELQEHGSTSAQQRVAGPRVSLRSPGDCLLAELIDHVGQAPSALTKTHAIWEGLDALDLLGFLYHGRTREDLITAESLETSWRGALENHRGATPISVAESIEKQAENYCFRPKGFRRFLQWAQRVDALTLNAPAEPLGSMRVQRLCPEAVLPGKERVSDSGYDLTVIDKKKT